MAFAPSRLLTRITRIATMVESQVANIPIVSAAAGRHGGPTVASYHCSQIPFISVGPSGAGTEPTAILAAFKKRAEQHPLQLARSLFMCFQSWAVHKSNFAAPPDLTG